MREDKELTTVHTMKTLILIQEIGRRVSGKDNRILACLTGCDIYMPSAWIMTLGPRRF